MTDIPETENAAAEISAAAPEATAPATEKPHGRLYWLWNNIVSGPTSFAKTHWLAFSLLLLLAALAAFMSRSYFHDFVIDCRRYFGALLFGLPALALSIRAFRRAQLRRKAGMILAAAIIGALVYFYGKPAHRYCSLYWRYKTLDVVRLKDLPETAHERIQPLNSVFTMASGQIANNNTPTEPHFVRIGDNYRFTMGAEPIYFGPRVFGQVSEIYDIPGTTPDIDLSGNAKQKVSFQTGENLKWGRNIYISVCRAFGLWRYLNYEPDGAVYMKDDAGEWVQVVPLIRWRGIIFPWPEFGGVQVINQQTGSLLGSLKQVFIGCGYYVPPEAINDGSHPFLKGQNIRSYTVSRYMAESFKFNKGFFAPFPGLHDDDIRIADMPEDVNNQPFVIYHKMSAVSEGAEDSLYHFFSLEPYNESQQGSVITLFIPADGREKVYAAFNSDTNLNLIGISGVPQLVINDHPYFDWSSHVPVENRPYIRTIDGIKRYFTLTTIVTKSIRNDKLFIGGNNPNIALTDQKTRRIYWMRPPDSATWIGQLQEQMKLPAGSPLLPPLPGASGPPAITAPPAEK